MRVFRQREHRLYLRLERPDHAPSQPHFHGAQKNCLRRDAEIPIRSARVSANPRVHAHDDERHRLMPCLRQNPPRLQKPRPCRQRLNAPVHLVRPRQRVFQRLPIHRRRRKPRTGNHLLQFLPRHTTRPIKPAIAAVFHYQLRKRNALSPFPSILPHATALLNREFRIFKAMSSLHLTTATAP